MINRLNKYNSQITRSSHRRVFACKLSK